MNHRAVPSSDADDRALLPGLPLVAMRRQIATCRAIADELERCLGIGSEGLRSEAIGAQLVEEVARLGCRALEAASSRVPSSFAPGQELAPRLSSSPGTPTESVTRPPARGVLSPAGRRLP